MKRTMTLITLLCIIPISMGAEDPDKPQSREAQAAAAKAEKAEDAAVNNYATAVRKAASDLIDAKIKAIDTYKAALQNAKASVNRSMQKATSDIVRKALDEEITRIDAEIKQATVRRIRLLKVKRNLFKWEPPQPDAVVLKENSQDRKVGQDNKYATIEMDEVKPSLPKDVVLDFKGSKGKIMTWVDGLPKQVVAIGGFGGTTLACSKDGLIVIGLGSDDHKKSWAESTFESLKDSGKSIKVKWDNGEIETFQLWVGKITAGHKRALRKTGHAGHKILIFATFGKSDTKTDKQE